MADSFDPLVLTGCGVMVGACLCSIVVLGVRAKLSGGR